MKNFQKFTIIIALISLMLTITFIIQTYAKYVTAIDGSTSMSIARWNILVNNELIENDTDLSNVIVPVFEGSNNIKEGVIAPTASRLL